MSSSQMAEFASDSHSQVDVLSSTLEDRERQLEEARATIAELKGEVHAAKLEWPEAGHDEKRSLLEATYLAATQCARANAKASSLERLLEASEESAAQRLDRITALADENSSLREECQNMKEVKDQMRLKRDKAVLAENDARRALRALEAKTMHQSECGQCMSLKEQVADLTRTTGHMKSLIGELHSLLAQKTCIITEKQEELMWQAASEEDLRTDVERARVENKVLFEQVGKYMDVQRKTDMQLQELILTKACLSEELVMAKSAQWSPSSHSDSSYSASTP